jgi:hypothetical protein
MTWNSKYSRALSFEHACQNRNNSCLATEAAANKAILEQTAKWPALCGADKVTSLPAVKPVAGAGTSESILWRDAERTFKTEPFREQMIKVLELVADGDYHQGMGYLTGFLLLLVPPGDVSKMLHRIGTDDKYTPGYWKGQPEAFVRDAQVYMELVKIRFPAVGAHLEKASLVPEAYAQKWFVGLCVHTMPFATLVKVFEAFLSEGYMFLFKLSLAIVEALQERIVATNTGEVNKLFELLRLDAKMFPDTETGLSLSVFYLSPLLPHSLALSLSLSLSLSLICPSVRPSDRLSLSLSFSLSLSLARSISRSFSLSLALSLALSLPSLSTLSLYSLSRCARALSLSHTRPLRSPEFFEKIVASAKSFQLPEVCVCARVRARECLLPV